MLPVSQSLFSGANQCECKNRQNMRPNWSCHEARLKQPHVEHSGL